MKTKDIKKWLLDLLNDEDDPNESLYDPVHIGGAILITMTAIGCLYWLLWTLLVYEGGIFLKLSAASQILFAHKTLRDFGYEGYPYAMGAFEGWIGNFIALVLFMVVLAVLHRSYFDAARRKK